MEKGNLVVEKASVGDLLVLCSILDNYGEFANNLNKLMSGSKATIDMYKLFLIADGKRVFGEKKLKKFYEENKETIDVIQTFSSVCDFINMNYDCNGDLKENSSLCFFYQYMLEHRDDIGAIKNVLLKLKKIGVSQLEFNEKFDFTNQVYLLYTCFGYNTDIKYFDNIVIIPNYEPDKVEYTTKGSAYKLVAEEMFGRISDYNKKVVVNTLIFDPAELPDDMEKETIFDKIVELRAKEKDCAVIKNSVDLSVSVDDLCSQFNSTTNVIERLDNVENKDEFHTVLLEIKERLGKLQTMSSDYDEKLLKKVKILQKKV